MRGEALALVMRGDAIHLARRSLAPDRAWVFEPVREAPPVRGSPDPVRVAFSAPMVTETRASWAGQDGTVVVSLGDDDLVGKPAWRGWSSGFVPYLEHRPYVDPDSGVWQLGSMPVPGGKRGMIKFERIDIVRKFHPQKDPAFGILELRRRAELFVERLHQRLKFRA